VRHDWADIEQKLGRDRDGPGPRVGERRGREVVRATGRGGETTATRYRRGAALFDAALRGNPFDPYVRLRRAEHDRVAVDHGLIAGSPREGRDAMRSVTELTPGRR
jgi:hypothetical protein